LIAYLYYMLRSLLIILISLSTYAFIAAQTPAFKAFNRSDGQIDFKYAYIKYQNDTLFVLTDNGEIQYFDGIRFYPYEHPESKYIFRDIAFLKNGYVCRNFSKDFWYKTLNDQWLSIKPPESYISLNDSLYALFNDSLYYFNEHKISWEFKKPILDTAYDLRNYYLYKYLDDKGENQLSYRQRFSGLEFYDILKDKAFSIQSGFLNRGSINGQNVLFNQDLGVLSSSIFPEGNVDIDDYVERPIEYRFYLQFDIEEKDKKISSLIAENNNLHFLCIDKDGSVHFPGSFNIPRPNYQKIRGELYFISFFDGLYKVNPYISYYSSENSGIIKNVRSIVPHQGDIWFGAYGSGFARLKNRNIEQITDVFTESHQDNILAGAFARSETEAWFCDEGLSPLFTLKNGLLSKYKVYINDEFHKVRANYIDTLHDGRIAFALQTYIFGVLDKLEGDRAYITTLDSSLNLKPGDSWVFQQDKNQRIWLGRNTGGAAVADVSTGISREFPFELDLSESFGVISMFIDEFDQLWLGTNRGLYLLPKVSEFDIERDDFYKLVIRIELPDLYSSNIQVIKEAQDYIVFGGDNGISFINKANYKDGVENVPIYQLLYEEDLNGSLTQNHGMYFDGRFLWVASGTGVNKIDILNLQIDSSNIEILFHKVSSGDLLLQIKNDELVLDFDKRNIQFEVKPAKNSSFLNNIFYDYVLFSENGDTLDYQQRSKSDQYKVNYLGPGKYKLEVVAFKNAIVKDRNAISIEVPYALNENPYFWPILLFILISATGLTILYRNIQKRRIAEKELALKSLEQEKEALHLQTIISTFNPHFINNSLHWAQSRYIDDEPMVRVIGRLSENIRYIFNNTKAGNAFHSIEKEMKLVDNYISIQLERFENSFEFIHPSAKSMDKFLEFKVPIMQMQIHIENAIEHGLRNRENSSFVKLEFVEDQNNVKIMITDDGCGREKAKTLESQGTQTGVKMLKEIHRIFNERNSSYQQIKSWYSDDIFQDENGISYGTRISITVPKNYNYEL